MHPQELTAIYENLQVLYLQEAIARNQLRELEAQDLSLKEGEEETEQHRLQLALHDQLKDQTQQRLSIATHAIKSTLVALKI